MILEKINAPNDIKKISPQEYEPLAEEIRAFLIEKISKTGGHLASNLGVVELTMAMHLAFNLPEDKIIWDVGHQSYTHKILSGRKEGFDSLRQYGGMSGFPKRRESAFDAFDTGHSSTSLSAGLGYVYARDIKKEKNSVVAVIGDGALTGGMALEALNNASSLKSNFIIVLNDNNMSISQNVGGIPTILNEFRTGDAYQELKEGVSNTLSKIPKYGDKIVGQIKRTKSSIKQLLIGNMAYEDMGITYIGPIDGHNINKMIKAFNIAKKVNHSVIVHVITQKGRGYKFAEKNPGYFHGVGPFDVSTGKALVKKEKHTYTDVFSNKICKMADKNKNIVAITAAMPDGTGLSKFAYMYPDRFFDVGIAEEHAVTFAAGLAAGGLKPVVAIYSSFLQRAYDQILHDVCIQNLPVIFAVDRAGLVGSDGETHQGVFDLSFLSSIPNMAIIAPKNKWELEDALDYAVSYDGPIAIRYPRGTAYDGLSQYRQEFVYGKSEVLTTGQDVVLLGVGSMVQTAMEVAEKLLEKGISATVVNARFVKPLDEEEIAEATRSHRLVVTLEENVSAGGYGENVCRFMCRHDIKTDIINIAFADTYIEHGSVDRLKKEAGMDAQSITDRIEAKLGRNGE